MIRVDKVLVPTDCSQVAARIAGIVGEIPGVKEVVLVHVIAASQFGSKDVKAGSTEAVDQVYRRMGPVREMLEHRGIAVRTIVETIGDENVAGAILALATREAASLIVVAPKSAYTGEERFLGSVSGGVLRNSTTDVLVIPPGPAAEHGRLDRKVLFPTDFSEPSLHALGTLESAGPPAQVVLLHVVSGEERTDMQALRLREAAKKESEIKARMEMAGIAVETITRVGSVGKTIARVAVETGASLIVMSRFGRMDSIRSAPLGTVTKEVAMTSDIPLFIPFVAVAARTETRELKQDEFPLANEIWLDYHETKGDPRTDRIFGVFVDSTLVSVARCRRHPDGYEVDAVFTPVAYRGHGYAKKVMSALVEACHHDVLYMHSVLDLVGFYRQYGFQEIAESELPPSIRARFAFAGGALDGANVRPMRRLPKPTI